MKYLRAAARTLPACALLPNTFGSRRLRRNRSFSSGEDFNEFSKLARAEPDAGCGKINGTAKLAVSQFQLRLPPVLAARPRQTRSTDSSSCLSLLFFFLPAMVRHNRIGPAQNRRKLNSPDRKPTTTLLRLKAKQK